jgi:hypothetical protein
MKALKAEIWLISLIIIAFVTVVIIMNKLHMQI